MSIEERKNKLVSVLHTKVIEFLGCVIDMFPHESELIIAQIFIQNQVDPKKVMENFLFYMSHEDVKKSVKEKDEGFFLNDNSIFSSLNSDKTNHIKKIWRSGQLEDDEKEIMWNWVNLFLKIIEKYQEL